MSNTLTQNIEQTLTREMVKFYFTDHNNQKAFCGLNIVKVNSKDTKYIALLTELDENPGGSVTNCVELIATLVYTNKFFSVEPGEIIWIEHYSKASYPTPLAMKSTFDLVSFSWNEKKTAYLDPKWSRCNDQTIDMLYKAISEDKA